MNQPMVQMGLSLVLITLMLVSALDAKELKCTEGETSYTSISVTLSFKRCEIRNQAITHGKYTIASTSNDSGIGAFHVHDNKGVKIIPHRIGFKFPGLTAFIFRNCAVKVVEAKHFEKMTNLLLLDLAGNVIENIQSDAFTNLRKLEALDLSVNQFESLHENLFASLHNLIDLGVCCNKIEELPENLLANLTNLQSFQASGNELTTLSENFFVTNQKLESIWLRFNIITTLSTKLFDDKHNLSKVDLGGNQCIDSEFENDRADFTRMRKILVEKCKPKDSTATTQTPLLPTVETVTSLSSNKPKNQPTALCTKPEAFMIIVFSLLMNFLLLVLGFSIQKYLKVKSD